MSTYLEKLDYLEETKDLIKNAIESKGVSVSDTDTFRDYADKIGEISGGGSTPEEDDGEGIYYRFLDYDGKLLYKFTEEEKNALTELPPCNEVHEGLNFCGWSWTLDELKSVSYGANVGAYYETTDGLTHLFITVKEPVEMQLYGGNGYLASVNWGDGSPTEPIANAQYVYHWYEAGDYDITFTHTISKGNYFQFYNLSWDKLKPYPYWNIDFKELRLGSGVSIYSGDHNFKCNLSKISIDGKNVSTIATTGFRNLEVEFFSSKADISNKASGTVYIKGKYPSYKYKKDYTKIANNFFKGSNIKNFIVPDGVLSIGYDVFMESNLESITLPNTLTSIGNNAFSFCLSLQEITIPDSVSSLGNSCFDHSENLKKVILPKNITVLSNDLFEYCGSLQEITLPEGITKISQYCFANCSTLQSITIPASVSDMNGGSIFNSCTSLIEVHMKPTTPPTLNSNAFGYSSTLPAGKDAKIYVPYSEDHSILAAYKAATNWSKYATYIVEEPND